jgi:hypothetical protein
MRRIAIGHNANLVITHRDITGVWISVVYRGSNPAGRNHPTANAFKLGARPCFIHGLVVEYDFTLVRRLYARPFPLGSTFRGARMLTLLPAHSAASLMPLKRFGSALALSTAACPILVVTNDSTSEFGRLMLGE